MNEGVQRFFIVTGGPGSGKTSLMNELKHRGYACTEEAGRGIIREQVTIGGNALPWGDRALFAELMLSWEIRSYRIAQQRAGFVFFDRGVPDVIGYLSLIGFSVPHHIQGAAEFFRYNPTVFVAPPWKEIFQQDGERKQDFDEAVRTYDALRTTYVQVGYRLVELPRVSIVERVRFVLDHAKAPGNR